MLKKAILILCVMLLIPIISGCNIVKKDNSNNNVGKEDSTKGNDSKDPGVKPQPKPVDPITEQIKKMSMDEKIGQMLVVGIDGYDINDNTKSLIENQRWEE